MAAVRAKTMQTITSERILTDGQPFAATMSAPRANGRAKIVCEKRISVRKRGIDPLPNIFVMWSEVETSREIALKRRHWIESLASQTSSAALQPRFRSE